ncbi:HNH endonuclease [Niallia taxi]|uniref:HNH endonuclease n=1 Tax=Niallia taxi TaxID=2499688 RepID=UPI00203C67DE|nr:HNH endonuclease [Niallia taxi]MCM3214036.1 HNH endonuclease [Niallia taxi]MED4039744.1 HNH endonuclease [Niallia taxi]
MNTYIVMQGSKYHEVRDMGIIWSPKIAKGGSIEHSWERMKEVKKGDRIFHYVKGNIVAISIAKEDCVEATRPLILQSDLFDDEAGYLVEVEYYELDKSVNVKEKFAAISPLLPIKYSPFQDDASGNSGYLYPCNEELAIKLLELIGELNIYLIDTEQLELSMDYIKVTEHNTLIPVIAETESEVKTKIRLGQQRFKKDLMSLWGCKCALCDIDLPELLKASRSKPWKDSTNEERNDPYNGILLCSNHDALYENGKIAFDGQGRLHISPEINEEDYQKYCLLTKKKIKLNQDNKVYFKWHKRNIWSKAIGINEETESQEEEVIEQP